MAETQHQRGEGVDWLRGRLRWEDRLRRLRRRAGVPLAAPATRPQADRCAADRELTARL
jgi:hypothetical protein